MYYVNLATPLRANKALSIRRSDPDPQKYQRDDNLSKKSSMIEVATKIISSILNQRKSSLLKYLIPY